MNRKKLLWVIIILTSSTTAIQYAVQGAMAANHNPALFPMWFWYTDFGLWALRAIIEAVCVAYLFTTIANKWQDKATLTVFEAAMLIMIAFTLGVIYRALGQGKLVYQVVNDDFYMWWTYAIASYTPIMMAGAGVAYRVQPTDQNSVLVDQGAIQEAAELRNRCADLQQRNTELAADNDRGATWAALPKAARARLINEILPELNGHGATVRAAAVAELGADTVSRGKARGKR